MRVIDQICRFGYIYNTAPTEEVSHLLNIYFALL